MRMLWDGVVELDGFCLGCLGEIDEILVMALSG